jgi:predicted metal-dependent phosphoesterase TrpH
VIDLHLHTTASDGALRPAALVGRAVAAGITTLSVTDHDTTAGLAEARTAAAQHGVAFVNGIEITAVDDSRDVHLLGYFVDPSAAVLVEFLAHQRADRLRRVREIADRLAALGAPIDAAPLLAAGAQGERSVGRPHVAQALVDAGHVRTRDDAFARYLATGQPAFVPRRGAAPADVVGVIHAAGGLAVLAHPGLTGVDYRLPALAAAGLDAIEARHCDYDAATEARYRTLAASLGLAITAGSDFHGETAGRPLALGTITMTAAEFAALEARCR